MDQLNMANAVLAILAGLLGSLGGYRILWMALERKLDERYTSKTESTEQDERITMLEDQRPLLEARMNKAEGADALIMRDLQYITTHINERILTTLETLTNELREMRREQSHYAVIQERHTTTMEQHSRSLSAFQSWIMRTTASNVPIFNEGGHDGQ